GRLRLGLRPDDREAAHRKGDDRGRRRPVTGATAANVPEDRMKSLEALQARLREVDDINSAAGLLRWDQTTYMPAGGAAARGRQLATLSRIAHETFTAAETGRLLDAAAKETASL